MAEFTCFGDKVVLITGRKYTCSVAFQDICSIQFEIGGILKKKWAQIVFIVKKKKTWQIAI